MSSTDSGYGLQFPSDSNSDGTKAAFIFRQMLARVDTLVLVKVVAVAPGKGSPPIGGTVDVQPLVNQIDGATPPNSTPHGTVYGLPYSRWRCGPWEIVGDPVVGAIGVALCCSRDISVVKNTKAQANPGSQRRFTIADGLFVPLGSFFDGAAAATIFLKPDGTINITDQNNNSFVSSTEGWVLGIGGTPILTLTSSLATFSVKVSMPDFETGSLPSYGTHTHGGVQTGSGDTGPPQSGT
jgi:hypothetical protein